MTSKKRGRDNASANDVTVRSSRTLVKNVELSSRAVEHGFGCANFRLANGCRRLDIHNHRMLQIDEIVVGVGITGDRVGRSGVAGRRIGWRDRLRLDRRRPAEGRIIENRQIFRDRAARGRIEIFDLGDASPFDARPPR